MSIKRNIAANYLGQGYTTVIGIAVLPLYLKLLGPEAYGLVGFFWVIQSWLQLLDLGISPAFAREVARVRGGSQEFARLRELLRSLEVIFLGLAFAIALGIAGVSTWIAQSWLKVETLPLSDVVYCIALMGGTIGVRCFAALYSSGMRGMECQVWLNGAAIVIANFRFVGGLGLLHWISREPPHFFEYQLLVGVLELLIIGFRFYKTLPGKGVSFAFSWEPVRGIVPFAGSVAFSAIAWVLLTQLDKLLLSHLLSLKEYGYFAVAALVANGITQVSAPISQALLPKMTYLLAQGKEPEMLSLYRKASQFIAVIVFPLAGTLAMFSRELLFGWTGDKAAAQWAGPVLFWYVLGNGLLAAGAFQYYLQYAHGKLKMHVAFNAVFAVFTVPIIVYASYNYSAIGAAMSWFGMNLIAFIVWPPIVHHHFAPGIHRKWLVGDLAPQFAATAILLFLLNVLGIPFHSFSRGEIVGSLLAIGVVLLASNALVSNATRTVLVADLLRSGK